MLIRQEKQRCRSFLQKKLQTLPLDDLRESDRQIREHILQMPAYLTANSIFCFVSMESEIQTQEIIMQAWLEGKRVAVPRCEPKGILQAYEITDWDEVEMGTYGILEPKTHCPLLRPEEIEFGIIPCIACDRMGYRLRYGGGYYDRYLAHTQFVTAAVCRKQMLLMRTPRESFDIPVDWVVTEDGAIQAQKENMQKKNE